MINAVVYVLMVWGYGGSLTPTLEFGGADELRSKAKCEAALDQIVAVRNSRVSLTTKDRDNTGLCMKVIK